MIELTRRQRETLDYVRDSILARGYPPTLREIGATMGIRSTNGVNDHLTALTRKGYLFREDMLSRGIRLTPKAGELYGAPAPVPAAEPAPASSERPMLPMLPIMDRDVRVPVGYMRRPSMAATATFAFRARGTALEAAGVLPGDLLFIDATATPRPLAVVLVRADDERVVLRRIIPGRDVTAFVATSPVVPEMRTATRDVGSLVCGVATGLLRPSSALFGEACAA